MNMKITTQLPVLFFLILESEGTWTGVNLTEEAHRYILRLLSEGRNVTSWGLGADYEFWTNRTRPTNVYPITARGHDLWCNNNQLYDPMGTIVRLRMTFDITKRVQSPFPAIFNVTLPMIKLWGVVPEAAKIDMNNATRIVLNRIKRYNPKIHKNIKRYRTTCRFQGRIDYAGYFAYKGSHSYHTVGVGHLQNSKKGLVRLAPWYLEYFVEGTYEQRIIVSV
uniref:DA-P36 family member n=1 Tax=Rhipicephalus zambeziensis TaxID=60191 RepID=A0A224YA21_9ACAR